MPLCSRDFFSRGLSSFRHDGRELRVRPGIVHLYVLAAAQNTLLCLYVNLRFDIFHQSWLFLCGFGPVSGKTSSDQLQQSTGPIKTSPGWFGSVFDAKEKI